MPPWFADPAHGRFSNDRALSQKEIDTFVAWVDGGAQEGSAADAPPPKQWTSGWNIPKPEHVVTMPTAFSVPAKGSVDYQYIVLPSGLAEDKWVQMVEARPSARSVVHHVVVYIRDPAPSGCVVKRRKASRLYLRGERPTASAAAISAAPAVTFLPSTLQAIFRICSGPDRRS
ncbi:MAG: hypothetical protein WKF37_22480 [Bryobacteraceae bacterium]